MLLRHGLLSVRVPAALALQARDRGPLPRERDRDGRGHLTARRVAPYALRDRASARAARHWAVRSRAFSRGSRPSELQRRITRDLRRHRLGFVEVGMKAVDALVIACAGG